MIVERLLGVACVLAAGMLATASARADDAGARHDAAAIRADAAAPSPAKPLAPDAGSSDAAARPGPGPVDASAPLPAGHPKISDDETGEDDPHAGHGGMAPPPDDGATDDPSLPAGTIDVQIQDGDGKPLPKTTVTLGVLYNSVAKGESRKHLTADTDASGRTRFAGLDVGTGVAYRVMVYSQGATFSAMPFQLPLKNGMKATLHVYPVEHDVEKTLVVSQSMIYAEVKDDRVQIQEAFRIYNVGKNAWVPVDTIIPLPPEFTAFATQQGMTDVGVEAVPQKGVRLKGTFPPGQQMIEFRWQLPYNGEADVRFDVGMLPHSAAAQVLAPASKAMTLDVDGFPSPQARTDNQGQRVLVTERQLRRDEKPMSSVSVKIAGLPTEGPGKIFATLLAAGGLAIGIVLGSRKPSRSTSAKRERARLLAELESLERARLATEIGPKTYERARRELLDDLARTFAADDGTAPPGSRAKPKAS
jgi:hypothetical protein